MVMLSEDLALSFEFEKLKKDLKIARDNYTSLIEEYSLLTGVVGKNLETEYMLKIGKKEHELFSCKITILRLKREIALFQSAKNRGEKIKPEKVKEIIDKEFADYEKQIEEQQQKLQEAQDFFSAPVWTDEETKEFKKRYHDIVRKLHPDLNPDLPAGAEVLWNRIQIAYKQNNWDELLLLADMVDELLGGTIDYLEKIGTLSQLKQEFEKISKKITDLEQQIADTRKRIPFSYETLLADPAAVRKKRQELDAQISLYKEHINNLKEIRATF
jgi:hypothetical protein